MTLLTTSLTDCWATVTGTERERERERESLNFSYARIKV